MSNEITDPYEKILQNMREYPNDIPITNGKISEAFKEFITLLFNTEEAEELASKTIELFGKDFKKYGVLHEYYQPENGEPILNPGFQNWNFLVLNMLAWIEGKPYVEEF